jgi:hypothetical protein
VLPHKPLAAADFDDQRKLVEPAEDPGSLGAAERLDHDLAVDQRGEKRRLDVERLRRPGWRWTRRRGRRR